jgi:hypothetical protein
MKKYNGEEQVMPATKTGDDTQVECKSMVVGVSDRFTEVFGDEELDLEVPEDFQPPDNAYEGWLG